MLQNKLALSPFDDKRHICGDGIHTYAHGYYRIALEEEVEDDE